GNQLDAAAIFASSVSVSPAIATVLRRALPPATTETVDGGTPSQRATAFSSARLAAPFSGTARTRTARCTAPSAIRRAPSTASVRALGVRRTCSSTPSRELRAKGGSAMVDSEQRFERFMHEDLEEDEG